MNSSASDGDFGSFLLASFALLRAERPDIWAELCRRLAPRLIRLEVGRESVWLRFFCDRVQSVSAVYPPDIEARTDTATILAVIDADASLTQAVLDDRLQLRGSPEDLLAFHDGLMAYVHGAVRAPSFPELLRRFRGLKAMDAAES